MSRSKQRTHCQHSCAGCKSWKHGYDSGDEAKTAQDRRAEQRDVEQLSEVVSGASVYDLAAYFAENFD